MTVAEFLGQVQDYCGAEYTRTQLKEVAAWAEKKSARRLALTYRYIVNTWDTQYKKLPTVKNLREMHIEMCEAYPQLSECYVKPEALITDGGSRERVAEMLTGLCESLNMRRAKEGYKREKDFS